MSEKLPQGQSPSSVGATPGASGSVLSIVITGTTKGLKTAYSEATSLTKSFTHNMKESMESLDKPAETLNETFRSWVGPLAAAAAGFAGFHEVMESFEKSEVLANTSKMLGVSTDELQKLQFAAVSTGASSEGMAAAMRHMNVFLNAAGEDGSKAAKALAELGLTSEEVAKMTPDQAIKAIADGLEEVDGQGRKAALSQEIFGRGAGRLNDLLMEGSEKLDDLGKEAEKAGIVLKSMDIAKQLDAEEQIKKLTAAFEALRSHLATALAPVISWIANGIQEWISDSEGFQKTFQNVADGVITAIGAIKVVWQGLNLMWDIGKVAIGLLGVAFAETGKAIAQGADFIGQVLFKTWDVATASFDVMCKTMKFGWYAVKDSAIFVFGNIVKSAGEMVVEVGRGLYIISKKLGEATQEAGNKMVEYAKTLQGSAAEELNAAGRALKVSSDSLTQAQANLISNYGKADTTFWDRMSSNAKGFAENARTDTLNAAAAIRDQFGGNAMSAAWHSFEEHAEKSMEHIKEMAKSLNEGIQIGKPDSKQEKYLKEAENRYKDYLFGLWKGEVDTAEKVDNLRKNQAAANKLVIDQQKASYDEFLMMKESRDAEYHLNLIKQAEVANENLANVQNRSNEDWTAMQDKFNADRLAQEQTASDANRMLWESDMNGKLAVANQVLGDLGSLMQSKNKELFAIGKAASIANAIVSTWEGAQKAYTSMVGIPVVGTGLATAAAAAAVAAGLMRVQQISSTSIGGGGGGGAVAGGASSASAPSAASQPASAQTQNITLVGSSFSNSQVRGMISVINANLADNVNLKAQVVEE